MEVVLDSISEPPTFEGSFRPGFGAAPHFTVVLDECCGATPLLEVILDSISEPPTF